MINVSHPVSLKIATWRRYWNVRKARIGLVREMEWIQYGATRPSGTSLNHFVTPSSSNSRLPEFSGVDGEIKPHAQSFAVFPVQFIIRMGR